MRLVDTDIVYDHPTHGSYDLADRRVVLVPLVGGDHSLISDYDQTDIAWLGYPLPGVGNCWRSARPTDDDSDLLGTLIGPHRAAIMRLMDRPITMQEIARALRYAPSTITFHCDWLTDAGLLWRDKRGRSVHAGRTPRGERLLTVMR